MEGSIQRVRAVLRGKMPDRAPMFDLIRNDAVIEYFTGRKLTIENASQVVHKAFAPAIDATRSVRLPDKQQTIRLPDGRWQKLYRWTAWTEHVKYESSAAYAAAKRKMIDAYDPSWTAQDQANLEEYLAGSSAMQARLGECYWMDCACGLGLMGLMGEVGVEQFCYYLADCPGIINELLEMHTVMCITWLEHLPADHGIEVVMAGDDIAFRSGPFLSPKWFEANYFPRMARIHEVAHEKGIKVMFHSDGDLNAILEQLVEAGIDGLNPIEVLAGMDVGDIHRRHPQLFMCGGIDVSQLLPFGEPREVYDATRRTIDAAEGRIMVGSSTELHNDVPLANFLAMRQAVLDNPYR